MTYDTEDKLNSMEEATGHGSLPPDLVFSDRMMSDLRHWLKSRNLDGYRIFHCEEFDLHDIDRHLSALGEASARWEPGEVGQKLDVLGRHEKASELRRCGFLQLRRRRIVLANWRWIGLEHLSAKTVWMCAAPSPEHYERLRQAVRKLRRAGAASVWQVVSGYAWADGPRSRREQISVDDLIVSKALRERIEVDIIRFFDPKVAAMYAAMRLPHRRGVLLHGPPGNGKTSLIRAIGSTLAHIPAMILRPCGSFDSDDLQQVLRRWSRQAPAILVIEDLNWLLKSIDISLLLNLLDGIDSRSEVGDGGLMLVATTNYPDQLDPALNNRPGRFDVVIEIPSPDADARGRFLAQRLPEIDAALVAKLVELTDRLSFAHLEELLRTSGLLAIHAGREQRSEEDLLTAVRSLRDSSDAANRGFPTKPEVPFGLEYLRKVAR